MSSEYEVKKITSPIFGAIAVVLVSTYLLGVLFFLLLTRRLSPPVPLRSLLFSRLRRRYYGYLPQVQPYGGHCFVSPVPSRLLSDREGFSRLVVFEDGYPLSQPHAPHEDIKERGNGLFSHWGNYIYFSASDNSNPLENGRIYTVREV